ncbi:GntR family transcriptional regulator [Noviherbaspirillum aerium]|uniref:GntR family transcriptional regulator n=1 Tax=Noviherbaspirillum aerium TaxID=2588497 RepID=UPI00178C513E|nr:GntR family transcriptional regulator [Noviherbaspirillum aerium]
MSDLRLPRYEQLRDALRARVTSGEWPPGSMLPSETDLAREYKVALGTMRQALSRAVEDGLLERVHGKGTFVRSELQDALMFRFFRFRDSDAEGKVTIPRSVIHELREIPLEQEAADHLNLKKGARGIFILRTRVLADMPALLEKIWLPYQAFKRLLTNGKDHFGDLLYPTYHKQCNVVITHARENIGFGTLSHADARLLKKSAGSPVAVIRRTAFSLIGDPVEYRISQGDALSFHYNVEIK